MSAVRSLAFRARTLPGTGLFVSLLVRFAPRLLPMPMLQARDRFVAYSHPAPVAEGHVLLLPRRFVATIWRARTSRADFTAFLQDAIDLARELGSAEIFINAGSRQDGRVVHVHGLAEATGRALEPLGRLDELYDRLEGYETAAAFTVFVACGVAELGFAVDSVNDVST